MGKYLKYLIEAARYPLPMSPHDRAAFERALRRLRDLHPEEFADLYDEEAANEDPPPPLSVIANK